MCSWTVITWIVVFGSSIVMLLWIIVYSFFFSSDFINEMQILFGGIPFWATVVFSTVVALGVFVFLRRRHLIYTMLLFLRSPLRVQILFFRVLSLG